MEKLNELVALGKKATGGDWTTNSRNAVVAVDDQANSGFVICATSGCDKSSNAAFIAAANPETILAIAEAFRALEQQRDALAAENAILKNGIGFFSYGSDSGFEEHDSAEKAIAAAEADIDYYRGDACDGWSEETDQTVWGVILQRATMIDERPRTEEDSYLGSHISSICDYALLPNLATPATDAYLNSARAEGVEIFAKHCDESIGFIEPEDEALYTLMEEQARNFAAQLRAGKDGE